VVPPTTPMDAQKQMLGWWKVESFYSEFKATGETKIAFGEKPNGYGIITPEQRMMVLISAEQRKKPETDEDCVAAFRSMIAYSGTYRVEGDRFITNVDIAWNEAWTGTDQLRFFKVEGDKLVMTTAWMPDPNTPDNPQFRGVLIWNRIKGL
jgi:Lipocalin-like domain